MLVRAGPRGPTRPFPSPNCNHQELIRHPCGLEPCGPCGAVASCVLPPDKSVVSVGCHCGACSSAQCPPARRLKLGPSLDSGAGEAAEGTQVCPFRGWVALTSTQLREQQLRATSPSPSLMGTPKPSWAGAGRGHLTQEQAPGNPRHSHQENPGGATTLE